MKMSISMSPTLRWQDQVKIQKRVQRSIHLNISLIQKEFLVKDFWAWNIGMDKLG